MATPIDCLGCGTTHDPLRPCPVPKAVSKSADIRPPREAKSVQEMRELIESMMQEKAEARKRNRERVRAWRKKQRETEK